MEEAEEEETQMSSLSDHFTKLRGERIRVVVSVFSNLTHSSLTLQLKLGN